jgi:hypothetical protein
MHGQAKQGALNTTAACASASFVVRFNSNQQLLRVLPLHLWCGSTANNNCCVCFRFICGAVQQQTKARGHSPQLHH